MAQNQNPVTKTPTKAFGNSPQSLSSPVPEEEGMDPEVAAYFASQSQSGGQAAGAQTEDEAIAAYFNQQPGAVETQPEQVEKPGLVSQGLDAAGRVLDYGGGAVRTLGFDVASKLAGKPVVTDADAEAALKGKAPSSAEFLRRMGVGEGGSLNTPLGKITSRGAAGLAVDIVADPLTVFNKTVKSIPYLRKLLNGPGQATEALGEAVYKSALKSVDDKLLKRGKGSVGEILIENGAPIAGEAKLAQKVETLSNVMQKTRQGLYDKAAELGVTANTAAEGAFKNAEAVLARMRKNPTLVGVADELQDGMNKFKAEGVPLETLSQWKTDLYDSLPASAFTGPKLKGAAKQFKAALAADMKNTIVKSGNAGDKGLGDAIESVNQNWGTLINATELMKRGGASGGGKLGTMIDGAVAAAGGPKAYAAKKGFDLATGAAAKTAVGKAFMQAGRTGVANAITRRGIVEAGRAPQKEEGEE